jgi:hypothetical protein
LEYVQENGIALVSLHVINSALGGPDGIPSFCDDNSLTLEEVECSQGDYRAKGYRFTIPSHPFTKAWEEFKGTPFYTTCAGELSGDKNAFILTIFKEGYEARAVIEEMEAVAA